MCRKRRKVIVKVSDAFLVRHDAVIPVSDGFRDWLALVSGQRLYNRAVTHFGALMRASERTIS